MTNHASILSSIRRKADQIRYAFPELTWTRKKGPGPDTLVLKGNGSFSGLTLEPGCDLVLSTDLVLPGSAGAVALEGDALECTLFSLYPCELMLEGKPIFADDGIPVAAGPALVTVLKGIRTGDNGQLELTIHIPDNQTTLWFNLHFTTPGLRAAFETLDLAWAQLTYAQSLAVNPQEHAAVEAAFALVPQDIDQFTPALLAQIETALAPLAPKARTNIVHIIGHSHIDMNWLWTWDDTVNVIHRDFNSVVSMMEDYPEMTFTHSQPATYEVIRTQNPQLFNKVVELIREGRWEPATITWVEGDTNMSSGEATARHMLESAIFTRNHLQTTATTLLEPDTFGHAGNLPQLAKSAGAERYYHHRANPGKEDRYPAYWWEGQDGTRLLAISTPSYNGEIHARNLVEAALYANQYGLRDSLHFHGVGDHGGGPARQSLDALRRFQQHPLLPASQCSTLAAYTRRILEAGTALPVHTGESATIFEGCYTTHADIKRQNRQGENELVTADALTVLAGLNSTTVLQPAWRTVLFNTFHDILDGSAIHEAYEKSEEDAMFVQQTARGVSHTALRELQQGLPEGSIAVTNPLGWEREDWVSITGLHPAGPVQAVGTHGHHATVQQTPQGLGFVARVPAFGTVSYSIEAAPAANDTLSAVPAFAPNDHRWDNWLTDTQAEQPYYRVETPFFLVYLRRDSGILTSFIDKRVNRELVAYGMRRTSDYQDSARADLALNVLQFDDEYPHGMSAWHLDEVHTTHSLLRGAKTRLLENGPARIVFEVQHHPRSSTITQQIIFYRDLPRVDFNTQVDWNELGSAEKGIPNLKAAFTAHLMECQAWFETPFAAVQRPADGQEVPTLRWADVGGSEYGFAILNDSKYGCDVLGTRLRLTLLRSGYEPDAISDVGRQEFKYSFLPHPGDWRAADVVRHAAGFNQPMFARTVNANGNRHQPAWQPRISGSANIIPAALKYAQDGTGIILRLYESTGSSGMIGIGGLPQGAAVTETNIIEQPLHHLAVINNEVQLTFRPWQVRTVKIVL
ncbi:MAG: alpha-mannosidase [Anaerolineae bacterium]|nr:alpha-mannosidase [Anaerolineae bacterium]